MYPYLWKAIWVLFSISRYRELFPDIGNSNSRYREINFRYQEIINFPISGNDFRISGIDFPISGNVFDFPISRNQFPISENRHPTEAGHSATLQHRPTIPPLSTTAPSNTSPIGDRHYDSSKSQCLYIHMQNSISATKNNHTTNYFVQKYRNLWRWINVLNTEITGITICRHLSLYNYLYICRTFWYAF